MEQWNILLVSSDKNASEDLNIKLKKLGWNVLGTILTGDKFLLEVEKINPELVIIDAELKGPNGGIGVALRIAKQSNIPLLFLISNNTKLKRLLKVCPFGFLKKPVDEQNLLITMESVNKRLRLEQQLKEQAEKIGGQRVFLQTMIDALAYPFYLIDVKDHSIKLFNKAANLSLSKKPSTCYKLTHGRSTPCKSTYHPCPLEKIKKTRKPFKTEHIHINREGDTRSLEIHAFPIFDKNGNVIQIVESSIDITNRRRVEEKLIASEKTYKQLIQSSNDAIYLLYDRKFEIINEKFQEMFGVTLEDVNKPGFDFMEMVAPKSRGLIDLRNQKLMKGEKLSRSYEFTALSKDGREIEVETSVSYIIYKKGIAVQGILRDITNRKRIERALRKAHDELERRVEKRTAELNRTNRQLKKEVIERKQVEVKIKHINTILSAIRNVIQLVVREKDRHQLIQQACNNLIETRGYFNAWIVLQDDSGKFTK
ncbi:MAG: PAS domain S-box protein, partial [Candidatus Aminicenantes bacterium]|nr:PAS domain S-box protein [Candidatus Aminicenantes bacterium]